MLAAILDGAGSLGASFGPFVVGVFGAGSEGGVSRLVMGCCILGAVTLTRQCYVEFLRMASLRRTGEGDGEKMDTSVVGRQ